MADVEAPAPDLLAELRAALSDFRDDARSAREAAEQPDNHHPDADEGYAVGLEYAAFVIGELLEQPESEGSNVSSAVSVDRENG